MNAMRVGSFTVVPLWGLLVILWLTAAPSPVVTTVQAKELPQPVIAVLNYQQLLQTSKAGKNIRKQVDGIRAQYQKTLQKVQAQLKKEEEALLKQRAVLSPDAFDKRRQAFERKVIDAQRDVQDRTRALERSLNMAMNEVQKAIVPLVKEQTTKLGFNLVIDRSQIMLALDSLDITDIILVELDKKLPSVKVKAPK